MWGKNQKPRSKNAKLKLKTIMHTDYLLIIDLIKKDNNYIYNMDDICKYFLYVTL